ncbi:MAG: hypothetical protein GY832_15355 [Chloroflexi bacterium]|nr:hypothetical protein [Chloroflexota bacterium]
MMTALPFIGIDPGKTGALALLYPDNTLYFEDMPVMGNEVNGAAVADIIKEFTPRHAFLEKVNAFGGQRGQSVFMANYGILKGALQIVGVPYTEVTPGKWKKHFGLGKDKDTCRKRAIELFPKSEPDLRRKMDADRAEAALIALWGSKQQ